MTGPRDPNTTPERIRSRRGALSSTSGTAAVPIRILRRQPNFTNSGNADGVVTSLTICPPASTDSSNDTRGYSSPLNPAPYLGDSAHPDAARRPVSLLTTDGTIALRFGDADPVMVPRQRAFRFPPAASSDTTSALPLPTNPPGSPVIPRFEDRGDGNNRPAYVSYACLDPAQPPRDGVEYAMSAPSGYNLPEHADRRERTPYPNRSSANTVGEGGTQNPGGRDVGDGDDDPPSSPPDVFDPIHFSPSPSPLSVAAPLLAPPATLARDDEQRQPPDNISRQRAAHDHFPSGRAQAAHYGLMHGTARGQSHGPPIQSERSAADVGWQETRVGGPEWWLRRIREHDREYALTHELARRTEELVVVRRMSWWYAAREVEKELLGERAVMGG